MERNYPKEFEEREVIISRKEFAEKASMSINNILDNLDKYRDSGNDALGTGFIKLLLSVYTADLMTEVFEELEVEPNGN